MRLDSQITAKHKFFFIIMLLTTLSLCFIVLVGSIQENVFSKASLSKFSFNIIPQGWGFFTRTPRETRIDAYFFENGQYKKINLTNFTTENFLGISRKGRAVCSSVTDIYNLLDKSKLLILREKSILKSDSLKKLIPIEITLKDNSTITKKEIFIIAYDILPWAWAENSETTDLIYNIAKVKLL
jgi:antimicrobial peptide system SdpA family protein